jgi:hypothetical protein
MCSIGITNGIACVGENVNLLLPFLHPIDKSFLATFI